MTTLNYDSYKAGKVDACNDVDGGWLPPNFTLDFIVNELRAGVGASDRYIAGYLSEVYRDA